MPSLNARIYAMFAHYRQSRQRASTAGPAIRGAGRDALLHGRSER